MRAPLDNLALVQDDDLVCVRDGGQPVPGTIVSKSKQAIGRIWESTYAMMRTVRPWPTLRTPR